MRSSSGRERIEGVYPILDIGPLVAVEDAERVLDRLLDGGARWIQLRAKSIGAGPLLALARRLVPAAERAGGRLMINDRADVALLSGASGVHVGQEDLAPEIVARAAVGRGSLAIGLSCHDLAQIEAGRAAGRASYLAFGPVYPTRSKANPDPVVGVDLLREACRLAAPLPVVAIGGITVERLAEVRVAGAASAAMISDLLSAPDVAGRTRAAVQAFGGPSR